MLQVALQERLVAGPVVEVRQHDDEEARGVVRAVVRLEGQDPELGQLAMSDLVVVGGGFMPKGSHNIIEPLALGKPVIVGPETWTIEYPAEEAIAAGVCRRVAPADLAAALAPGAPAPTPEAIRAFLDDHAGAVEKTLAAIPRLLSR